MVPHKIIDSFNAAIEGIVYVLKSQRNMRIHFVAALLVLVLSIVLKMAVWDLLFLLSAVVLVLVVEMINTVIELTIDLIKDTYHPLARGAKDVGAGAVLIASFYAVCVAYLVFFRKGYLVGPLEISLGAIRNSDWHLAFVALVVVAILTIIVKVISHRGTPFRGGFPSIHAALAFSIFSLVTLLPGTPLIIVVLGFLLIGGGLFMLMMFAFLGMFKASPDLSGGPKVGVINISGSISAGTEGGMWPFAESRGSRATMSYLRQAAEDDSIKAVVLRINSPGGSGAAAQAIYSEVQRLSEKKPVVASMADVAASGAYWIASAADVIVANPATITGSIGVIFETLTFYDFIEKYGLGSETITSGKYKDTGSPLRPMRPDERVLLEEMLMDIYEQFVSDIAKARGMDEAAVRQLADGRVYTGAQALEVGLVDELGNFYDAADKAAQLGKIKGRPKLKEYGSRSPLSRFFDAMARAVAQQIKPDLVRELSGTLMVPVAQPECR